MKAWFLNVLVISSAGASVVDFPRPPGSVDLNHVTSELRSIYGAKTLGEIPLEVLAHIERMQRRGSVAEDFQAYLDATRFAQVLIAKNVFPQSSITPHEVAEVARWRRATTDGLRFEARAFGIISQYLTGYDSGELGKSLDEVRSTILTYSSLLPAPGTARSDARGSEIYNAQHALAAADDLNRHLDRGHGLSIVQQFKFAYLVRLVGPSRALAIWRGGFESAFQFYAEPVVRGGFGMTLPIAAEFAVRFVGSGRPPGNVEVVRELIADLRRNGDEFGSIPDQAAMVMLSLAPATNPETLPSPQRLRMRRLLVKFLTNPPEHSGLGFPTARAEEELAFWAEKVSGPERLNSLIQRLITERRQDPSRFLNPAAFEARARELVEMKILEFPASAALPSSNPNLEVPEFRISPDSVRPSAPQRLTAGFAKIRGCIASLLR